MLLFACSQVLSGYVYNTVGIDIESNLDLRNTSSCRRDTIQTELSEGLVVSRELTLTLYNVDIYSSLVISCSGKDLTLLGRDCGISLDQTGCDTAHGLDRQRQRSNIQKKDITCTGISCQFTTLNGSTDGYALIRVQALVRLMSGQGFYLILYSRDTGRTTYQKDFGKVAGIQACIFQCGVYRACSSLYQVMSQLVEFCTGQVHVEVLRSLSGCCDEGQVDVCGACTGKLFLCFLSCLSQSLESHLIVGKVYTLSSLELGNHVVGNFLVEVIAAQVVVTSGCQNFDNAVTDLDDRYIKGTAAQVVYHDLLLILIVKAVCQCSCGRLVDDTFYIQACDLTCILGCLTLCVVEVCRNGDNCLGYFLTEIVLSVRFQFLKDHCGDLLRRIFLSFDLYSEIASHMSLDGRDGSVGVGNSLTFCRLTYQSLASLCECYYGRCGSGTFRICNNYRFSTFHDCYAAICCT